MATKLLVLADLGHFKAYRLEAGGNSSNPRLQLLENWETNITHHLSEDLSDQAGRYRRGVPAGTQGASALSDGEHHNLDLERRRRAVKTLARRIGELLDNEEVDGCYLAADRQINAELLDEMGQRARSRIQRNVPANLTGLKSSEIFQRFSE